MDNFPQRLREERKRLGLSQDGFGAAAGVSKNAQFNYESGTRLPDVGYLGRVQQMGADVVYLLMGVRAFDPSAAPHGEVAATLPERLQQERKRLQFTAVQLADKAGVDRVALTKFESGELVPDATALQKLHAAGVDVAHVLLSLRAGSHAGADADDGTRALLQHYQQAGEEARAALRTLAALLARSS